MNDSPIVIAHRGASGYLPEHTLAAKALAHGQRADYLEQDVLATRDRQLVVLHDLHLDDVSDVAQRFPDRQRADGRHYVVDFDLAELRTLRIVERRLPGSGLVRFPQRFPADVAILRIATLAEELELIRGLNRSSGRTAGIYTEIKSPTWHRQHGIDLAQLLLAALRDFGYSRKDDLAFVQCFEAPELERVKSDLGCELKLIQLIEPEPEHADLVTADGLRRVARYAFGIGPHYSQLITAPGGKLLTTALASMAHDAGLHVHPYTFRRDELPEYVTTVDELLEFALRDCRVDGVFCDHPDVAVRVRDSLKKVQ